MNYLIQVSDYPSKMIGISTQAESESWITVFSGKAKANQVRETVGFLAKKNRHVRSFRGTGTIGREFYSLPHSEKKEDT